MKYMYSQSEGAGRIGNGLVKRWVGCALGLVLFGSVAMAQNSAMTQQQYLQWMANICGDRIPASATGQDYVNWARGKGMSPAGGWQLNAKLTKDVVAQTLVQLLNLAPRKGNFDAVRILEREGILLSSTEGYVSAKNLVAMIDDGLSVRTNNGRRVGQGGDDDDESLTPTKPGNGPGGYGPPGLVGIFPGKGNQKNHHAPGSTR